MRMWAALKEPQEYQDGEKIYKIMIYETQDKSSYVFLYNSIDAVIGCGDEWYENLSDALAAWTIDVDSNGWHQINDPLPDCQDDAFLPIRVKGRNIGKPIWGSLEILKGGIWIDYCPD